MAKAKDNKGSSSGTGPKKGNAASRRDPNYGFTSYAAAVNEGAYQKAEWLRSTAETTSQQKRLAKDLRKNMKAFGVKEVR
jgi:hypothetical protein